MCYMISICVPFPSTEKGFSSGFHPTYGPCMTSVRCTTIHSTFINKNELVWLVCSYTSCKYRSLLHAPFKRCARKLKHLLVSDIVANQFCIPFSWYNHPSLMFSISLMSLPQRHAFRLVLAVVRPNKHLVCYLAFCRDAVNQ